LLVVMQERALVLQSMASQEQTPDNATCAITRSLLLGGHAWGPTTMYRSPWSMLWGPLSYLCCNQPDGSTPRACGAHCAHPGRARSHHEQRVNLGDDAAPSPRRCRVHRTTSSERRDGSSYAETPPSISSNLLSF